MSAISDAAHSASTKKGEAEEGRDHSGGTVTNHLKLMQDAMLELLWKIKFPKKKGQGRRGTNTGTEKSISPDYKSVFALGKQNFSHVCCVSLYTVKGQVGREAGSKLVFTGSLNFSQSQIRDSSHSIGVCLLRSPSLADQRLVKDLSKLLLVDIFSLLKCNNGCLFLPVLYLRPQLASILLIALFKYLPSIFCPSCHRARSFRVCRWRENLPYMCPYMGPLV